MKKILFVYGTRPEAIKMAPLIRELRQDREAFAVEVCLTGQHREMLDQVNTFFGISGDYDLDIMRPSQTLSEVTARCISGLEKVLRQAEPDLVFAQGDTTTVLSAALAAYYAKVRFAHLEAGLRSGDKYSPFPEELNRKIAGAVADYHFAPTPGAAANLAREGILRNVYVVGNTVIDALHLGLALIKERGSADFPSAIPSLDFNKRIILVTGHRRESFGPGFEDICAAIRTLAISRPNVEIVYPVHLNPNVREPVNRLLRGLKNVHLAEPMDYPQLIWLMERSFFVLTDSGGIQEEAPALGKPVLVMRDVTERMEGVDAGTARLVGTDAKRIVDGALELLDDPAVYLKMAKAVNPYGDGKTSGRIADILRKLE